MAAGGGAVATSIVATLNAIKASGVLVEVEPREFIRLVDRMEAPLVVRAKGGLIKKVHKYLTSYKGLAFYTKSKEPLRLSSKIEIMEAVKMAIPEM